MLNFFSSFSKLPALKDLPLKPYLIDYSLDRLAFGVDNIHFDVHISPQLRNALKKTTLLVMIKHSHAEQFYRDYKKESRKNEKDILRNLCTDVLMDGINLAKSEGEHQIDYLGQAALAKLFLEEVKNQYKNIVDHFEQQVRAHQLSAKHNDYEEFKTRGKLAEIKLNQSRIIRLAGEEMFLLLTDIQNRSLRNMRETHFDDEKILPGVFFNNPILHTDDPSDDFFLIEEYILLGKRSQDPDTYNNVQSMIYGLLNKTDLQQKETKQEDPVKTDRNRKPQDSSSLNQGNNHFDQWIMETSNIHQMFNRFDAQEHLERARDGGAAGERLKELRNRKEKRQILLDFFYREFNKTGILKQIVAAYEMKSIYGIYCPPLAPRYIREYLVDFWSRRSIIRELKRKNSLHGGALPLAPLKQTIKRIKAATQAEKKVHLFNFLIEFARYHRDIYNALILKNAMEAISIVTEEKILQLSKGNQTLFEFLLPTERIKEEKPVINHVILKADIRGSIKINHTMRLRGLNPASHFSLNFFDPISEILWNYRAEKVFIEGDAIILSIFEHKDTPQGWYSVARACGLAIRMLQIVQRYNIKNQENKLPILELGIGICYCSGPPSYLYDGDSKIMISPAINMADRLSGCSKYIRKHMRNQNPFYNLYVFKNAEEDDEDSNDDHSLRYNVNGIELSTEGFLKLSGEINLTKVNFKEGQAKDIQFYSGKVPTLNGNYQQLIIREATVFEIDPNTLRKTKETTKKYYEICSNQEIYDFINNFGTDQNAL
ncbi:MAG: hypothetical protein PHN98_09330 [Smithellaceae bacterium]|nr:hypothetical protein [Smithellaceae bacterium]